MLSFLCHLLISLLLLTGFALPAGAVTLEEANADFSSGDYAKAAEAYEQLMDSSGPAATRLYNLGNARFRLGQHGPAILAYERAALLAPRDPDIRANLKLARQSAAAHEEPPSRAWWEAVLHGCSLHEWSWITMSGAIAGVVLGIAAGSLGGFALWHRRGETRLGIITAAQPVLRLSPFAEAASAGSPGTGRTVQLSERSNGWVYVTVPGANLSGWLPDKDVPPLMPTGAR